MPPEARCAVFEDNKDFQKFCKEFLEDAGHSVVVTGSTREEALEAVTKFTELGVQVAVIDGNLNLWESSGADAQAIIAAIKKVAPAVKTVGMSALTINGVDINVGKGRITDLGEEVTKL